MTKLIVITDPHIVPAGQTIIGIDPLQRLTAAIAHIHHHNGDATLVVITGDLVNNGDAASYARLKSALGTLKLPSVLLIGNHDDRDTFRAAFPEAACDPHGFVQSYRDVPEGRLVFLDTVKSRTHRGGYVSAGLLCASRRAWLERVLTDARSRPVFLFMHHPPHKTGFAGMDLIRLEDETSFYDLIARHGNVRHIFAGHIHRTISGSHRGVPFSIFKSPVHQQPLDFASLDTSSSNAEPAAYGIVFLTADGVLVHTDDYELSTARPSA